jgi:hypothetical protein
MKDGRITLTSVLVFVLVGTILWCAAGTFTSVSSFQYIGGTGTEKLAVERDAKEKYITPPHIMAEGIWALCGVGTGILILLSYTSRQKEDYFTPLPSSLTRLRSYRLLPKFVRPKTLAEAKLVPLASLLGIIGGVLLSILLLPHLGTSETLLIRSAFVRVSFGLATTGFATMFILPFSLWLIARFAEKHNLGEDIFLSDSQIIGRYITQGAWFIPAFPLDEIKPKEFHNPFETACAFVTMVFFILVCWSVYHFAAQGLLPCCFTIILEFIIFAAVFGVLNTLAGPPVPHVSENQRQAYLDLRKATTAIRSWAKNHFAHGKILEKENQLKDLKLVSKVERILEDRILAVAQYSSGPKNILSKFHYAILHMQLGFLYRMMNSLDKAEHHLQEGVAILDTLHTEVPCNDDYTNNLVIGLFRLAELSEVSEDAVNARKMYTRSLNIASSLKPEPIAEVIQSLIRNSIAKTPT